MTEKSFYLFRKKNITNNQVTKDVSLCKKAENPPSVSGSLS